MIETTTFMMGISIFVSLTTLITFVYSMRKESEKRGARQAELDGSIRQIMGAVETLSQQLVEQQREITQLKLWMELLLQQHHANHSQNIRRDS